MTNSSLTADERNCLRMWFRQAIVEVEKQEALKSITEFYQGAEAKPRDGHHQPVIHTARRARATSRAKELV